LGLNKSSLVMISVLALLVSTLAYSPLFVFGSSSSPACGSIITKSTTLKANLGPCAGNGLVIRAKGITLNCNFYTISGSGIDTGINITGMTKVTIKNCFVTGFSIGISLSRSSNNKLLTNFASGNINAGFSLTGSSGNTLLGNTANQITGGNGFYIGSASNGNTITGNVALGDNVAFEFDSSSHNTITGNTADANGYVNAAYGFFFSSSSGNAISTNTADGPSINFFFFTLSSNNTLVGNIADSSTNHGFLFNPGNVNNRIVGNTADKDNGYGYNDYTTGSGTLGTANMYSNDECSGNGSGGSSPAGLCSPQS
jgi:parallel beta-helix repeat protein